MTARFRSNVFRSSCAHLRLMTFLGAFLLLLSIFQPFGDPFKSLSYDTLQKTDHPVMLPTDRIYDSRLGAFVLEEYKLIFVSIPKVACSEWKRMFMRMIENPQWCKIRGINAHDPNVHRIPYLSTYPIEVATEMMISSEWTKAVFVREPKERVLSAFLDKAVKERWFYKTKCCEKLKDSELVNDCAKQGQTFPSFLHYVTTYPEQCTNVHWEAQAPKIDSKWWPYFNFIGYQNQHLQEDAKRLLSHLYSTKDPVKGRNAWERFGSSGWGDDNDGCENRTHAFLEENTSTHRLETNKRLMEWYSADTEKIVEEYWKADWEQQELVFPKVKLFP